MAKKKKLATRFKNPHLFFREIVAKQNLKIKNLKFGGGVVGQFFFYATRQMGAPPKKF